MNAPAPLAVRESKAAKMLDLPLPEFRALVSAGALPRGKEIAPGCVRWSWAHIEAIRRGLTMDHPEGTDWRWLICALDEEKSVNRYLSKETQRAVSIREGTYCTYCGSEDGPFEFDHIFPVSRGGSNDASNLTLACRSCNSSKRDKTLKEWMANEQT